jgi:histone H3/H4
LRAGRANCMSNVQQDMIEQTLAILASMMQQAAHDATLYCAEAKRTVIMPRDIELALKRLVLPGSALLMTRRRYSMNFLYPTKLYVESAGTSNIGNCMVYPTRILQ